MTKPLEGLLVVEFSQYLAGPAAGLRLADLGARVIKIERPGTGDAGRQLNVRDMWLDGLSYGFHTFNRNKQSVAANLKDPQDLELVMRLVARADVMTHNFRPGVMERIGLGYEAVAALNPGIVYGVVTGYGAEGPWRDKPGQDLLVQAISGLCWLTGDADQPPVPFGLAVADMYTGVHLAQGVLAAVARRRRTGRGAHVAVSLMESALDLQFEVLTTHWCDGGRLPDRSAVNNAHAYLGAPYGIYATADGYIALAMGSVPRLGELLGCQALAAFTTPTAWFSRRDEIKAILAEHLKTEPTAVWLRRLDPAGYWCAEVQDWKRLVALEGFACLDMVQEIVRPTGRRYKTTRCPIHVDGAALKAAKWAPDVGEDNAAVAAELQAGVLGGWWSRERPGIPERSEADVPAAAPIVATADPLPLAGLLVLDMGQFLSGPSAALRLADLGARVIKIERPGVGDICRSLYISDVDLDGDSTLFHAINRNKESAAFDLKEPGDLKQLRELIRRADVLIENFRPGVAARLGLDYQAIRELNPRLIYGSVTGYGTRGPWREKPGQDLLVQALSGLAWLSGDAHQPPVPMGLSVADLFAGAHLVQGILACLARRDRTGRGGLVEVSLLESALDIQFEVLTLFFNDGGQLPRRSDYHNAHAYLGAPYGIYATADGYLALAMGSIAALAELIGCKPLQRYTDPGAWFAQRDEIKRVLAAHLATCSTAFWLARLEPADFWCAEVLDWRRLLAHDGLKALDMLQEVERAPGVTMQTTRCPIRFNGDVLTSRRGAPGIGEHTHRVKAEYGGRKTGA